MNFNQAFPDARPDETVVPGLLRKTDRYFSCDICKKVTGWRYIKDGFETPCCSDECLDGFFEREQELAAAARIDEHQNGTASDLVDVRCEVMPMSAGSDAGRRNEAEDTAQPPAQAVEEVQGGVETHQQTSTRAKRNPEAR